MFNPLKWKKSQLTTTEKSTTTTTDSTTTSTDTTTTVGGKTSAADTTTTDSTTTITDTTPTVGGTTSVSENPFENTPPLMDPIETDSESEIESVDPPVRKRQKVMSINTGVSFSKSKVVSCALASKFHFENNHSLSVRPFIIN